MHSEGNWGCSMEALADHGIHFEDLHPHDVRDMFTLCQGCVYWEMPRQFATRPSFGEMLRMKTEWLARHSKGRVLGKIARENGDLLAFAQFGPPELYPQRVTYDAGPVSHNVTWILLTFTGAFGIHRVYMGKYLTGLLYFLTGGLFLIGVLYDYWTLNEQVSEVNLRRT